MSEEERRREKKVVCYRDPPNEVSGTFQGTVRAMEGRVVRGMRKKKREDEEEITKEKIRKKYGSMKGKDWKELSRRYTIEGREK